MKNLLLIAATALIVAGSSIAASADPFAHRFGAWDVTELGCSSDTARPNLCARLFTFAAALNTPQWLVAFNDSPIVAVEWPSITAAAAWINGTPPAMGDVMAYGEPNTPQWLVAFNASPIVAVEWPSITAVAAWINGTPPAMGDVMAYGED